MASKHHTINYVEFPAPDLAAMKAFYGAVFGWTFQDWGENYVSFHGAGVDGGFDQSYAPPVMGGALVILYSDDLQASRDAVDAAGGDITMPPFDFPGGRRFHFRDPAGNALAVWTKRDE